MDRGEGEAPGSREKGAKINAFRENCLTFSFLLVRIENKKEKEEKGKKADDRRRRY